MTRRFIDSLRVREQSPRDVSAESLRHMTDSPNPLPTGQLRHRWAFGRTGGVEQVILHNGHDLVHLDQLDQKLWAALACPARAIDFDPRTLELLDLDKDGRIRAPEVLATVRWVRDIFRNPNDLFQGSDVVPLSAINDATPDGSAMLAGIRQLLAAAGKPDASSVSLSDASEIARSFAAARLNGDGVVPPGSASDDGSKKLIEEIVLTLGGVTDRSGQPGIDRSKLETFLSEANRLLQWQDKSATDPAILPLGDRTAAAAQSLRAVRTKIDDYFARTRLAAFDPRATPILNRAETEFLALASKDLTLQSEGISQLPIARVEPDRPLPLQGGVNPAWQSDVARFASNAVTALLGDEGGLLAEDDWRALQAKLSAYEQWLSAKPATAVEKLGLPRLREIVSSHLGQSLASLIDQDAGLAPLHAQIQSMERLIRIHRDFVRFLNNFVSFSEFYARRGAIFQAGTLYLDGRSCDLCVRVADAAKHAALAGLARAYLAYCDCTRAGSPKMTIAAAFTAGDSDHLMIGRNGVFYDRNGQDWDATIIKIIENPISIRQAFWAPYKKFVRMIEEQVAKRAASADAASHSRLSGAATQVANLDPSKPPVPAPAKKVDIGTVAALGVALGSLATFLGLIFAKVVDLGWWAPIGLVGILLAISGPSVLIAWLKLRQRNLGPILDANGWAINGRMKINVPFGAALSRTPKLPPHSEIQVVDPFGESHKTRNAILLLILLLGVILISWRLRLLNPYLPPTLQRRPPPVRLSSEPGAPVPVFTGSPATNPVATPLIIGYSSFPATFWLVFL